MQSFAKLAYFNLFTDTYMRLEKGFEMSNVLLFLSSIKPDSMESVYYHSGKLTDADERNQVYRLLCANEKLVDWSCNIGQPFRNTFHEKTFLLFNYHRMWIYAVRSTPSNSYIRPKRVKVIYTVFYDRLSVPTKRSQTLYKGSKR